MTPLETKDGSCGGKENVHFCLSVGDVDISDAVRLPKTKTIGLVSEHSHRQTPNGPFCWKPSATERSAAIPS